jgi:hypothetical protein
MTLRDLQNLAHSLRPHSDRICKIASLSEIKFRATTQGLLVIAGWGSDQIQIYIDARELSDRPCDASRMIAKLVLNERLRQKEECNAGTIDTGTTSDTNVTGSSTDPRTGSSDNV